MLAQGADLNIQGRYADIEELGNDVHFDNKVVYK